MEMQDLGSKLRMVVMAHRRITLVKKAEEAIETGVIDPHIEVRHYLIRHLKRHNF